MAYRGCVAGVVLNVPALSGDVVLRRVRVLARLPHPHELSVVAAPAAVVDMTLRPRAQSSPVLTAAPLRLRPAGLVQAAAHTLVRAAAHAKRLGKRPAELRAGQRRRVLERDGRFRGAIADLLADVKDGLAPRIVDEARATFDSRLRLRSHGPLRGQAPLTAASVRPLRGRPRTRLRQECRPR